jgi:RNase P subunit RPR2
VVKQHRCPHCFALLGTSENGRFDVRYKDLRVLAQSPITITCRGCRMEQELVAEPAHP